MAMAYHTAYLVPFTEAIVNKIMDDKRIMHRRNNELLIESFPTIGFALFKFPKQKNFITQHPQQHCIGQTRLSIMRYHFVPSETTAVPPSIVACKV